jgi:hypothetical protein
VVPPDLYKWSASVTFSGEERQCAIQVLVSELRAESASLEEAMRQELARSPKKRLTDGLYPMAARDLLARVTNLKATISTLEAAAS